MALTYGAILGVKVWNDELKNFMYSYYGAARLVIERLEHDPQFIKYLTDTTSGAVLYGKLKALLEQVEEANKAGKRLFDGVGGFLQRQIRINESGR